MRFLLKETFNKKLMTNTQNYLNQMKNSPVQLLS